MSSTGSHRLDTGVTKLAVRLVLAMRSKLLSAIRRHDLVAVKTLLAAGASLEWSRWRGLLRRYEETPLQAAVTSRLAPIVECLLDHGANPNSGPR